MKNLAILGSTGSIGVSTLEVVAAHPDRYRVCALSGGRNVDALARQIELFRPAVAAVVTEEDARRLRSLTGAIQTEILSGVEGLVACAEQGETDLVVSAIVGAAGLIPTLAAVEAGKDVALANKETLVTAGSLVMSRAEQLGVRIFPVDSEHSAIFQSLEGHRSEDVRRLILTASGGPFRDRSRSELAHVTPDQALAHPNWSMGRKISIDSATMMNKGLEVIEAHWLFRVPGERISVHIHPQSIVHSMVEYRDGSVIAQMGVPDMKGPIAYALSYPQRLLLDLPPLDLCALDGLTFRSPDGDTFPCLELAYAALKAGGSAPAVLNAANEVAVEAFLEGQIPFLGIPAVIEEVLGSHSTRPLGRLEDALGADELGREEARRVIRNRY